MNKKVIILDYGLGNLFSVQHALNHLGVETEVTADKTHIQHADAIILPGVGAFGEAMKNLSKLDLILPLKDFIAKGKPFLGVCLGMQLLFEESEEFGISKGLGIIPGTITRFNHNGAEGKKARVPQIAWNQILKPLDSNYNWDETVLSGIKEGEYMYFVHSLFASPLNRKHILTETEYEGFKYCSSVLKDNVFATQFHPEKSAKEGLKIYKNWLSLIK